MHEMAREGIIIKRGEKMGVLKKNRKAGEQPGDAL